MFNCRRFMLRDSRINLSLVTKLSERSISAFSPSTNAHEAYRPWFGQSVYALRDPSLAWTNIPQYQNPLLPCCIMQRITHFAHSTHLPVDRTPGRLGWSLCPYRSSRFPSYFTCIGHSPSSSWKITSFDSTSVGRSGASTWYSSTTSNSNEWEAFSSD